MCGNAIIVVQRSAEVSDNIESEHNLALGANGPGPGPSYMNDQHYEKKNTDIEDAYTRKQMCCLLLHNAVKRTGHVHGKKCPT
jgi:hypothetical protein